MTTTNETAFLDALRETSRKGAARRERDERAGTPPSVAHPLLDENLRAYALHVLEAAKGPLITNETPFIFSLWMWGATHVGKESPGLQRVISIRDFVALLAARSNEIAAKKKGWVVEPTTNSDGKRTNESTKAMHALFLDCDGAGAWDRLLGRLYEFGFAHIAYQSGGYTPEMPKWRIVLPLSNPFPTTNDIERAAWKSIYGACRTLIGAVGELSNVGFDARTDGVCIPWFLTEKRQPQDPTRLIAFHLGASLNLLKLAMLLPELEEHETHTYHEDDGEHSYQTLESARLEEIVSALATATANVPKGRRDLYLALPGVLLDRGLSPDDVLTVCESVSARYPRGTAEAHADNVRCARTTVAKFEKGEGNYTRIGTLNETWPEVATAIDRVLPNPAEEALRQATNDILRENGFEPPPPPPPPVPTSTPSIATPAAPSLPTLPADHNVLRKMVVSLRAKKRNKAKQNSIHTTKNIVDTVLLDNVLNGKNITLGSGLDRRTAAVKAAQLLGYKFPRTVPGEAAIEILRAAVNASMNTGESPTETLQVAKDAYEVARNKRAQLIDASNAKKLVESRKGL